MNYPVWELTTIGGGTLIAVISILHVYIAHFAVGGGIFIWLTDLKGFRDNNPGIHEYLKKHIWFFLLITMVFGAVSGVGIWFAISLVNPSGTSILIHNFVFAWAIEWVFFLGEIISLLVLYYQFDSLGREKRLKIGFIYFILAWLSLFAVNGVLSFMLTPGKWLDTGSFWFGFFNITFLPTLVFRTMLSLMIAGIFSYVTSINISDINLKKSLLQYSRNWIILSGLALIPTSFWCYFTLPYELRETNFHFNPQTSPMAVIFIFALLFTITVAYYIVKTSNYKLQLYLVSAIVVCGLFIIGSFEYMREISRKPYVIQRYMFSSSILKSDIDTLNNEGFLQHVKWSRIKTITDENRIDAGNELFRLQCLCCHTINGIRNDIISRTSHFTYEGLVSQLTGQGKVLNYMPPFIGTNDEKEALALYIYKGLHNNDIQEEQVVTKDTDVKGKVVSSNGDYILLVWNSSAMRTISDCDKWFSLQYPGNKIEAQLIKKGPIPEMVSDDIIITYSVPEEYQSSPSLNTFWDYADIYFKNNHSPNDRILVKKRNNPNGMMTYNEDLSCFESQEIPVVPFNKEGNFTPYIICNVEAKTAGTDKTILASAMILLPVSNEVGCKKCHGGVWKFSKYKTGISDETAQNILKAHDRINKTSLLNNARSGQPMMCKNCHKDPSSEKNNFETLSLSASIHSFHANYMHLQADAACATCHPSALHGPTSFYRGIHSTLGLTCVECHGSMGSHAAALLKNESGKPQFKRLFKNINNLLTVNYDTINPRSPWIQQPDCLTCHKDFNVPDTFDAFNTWSKGKSELFSSRTDNIGIRCPACHGAVHALYPAVNPHSKYTDNAQPVQYSGKPYPIGSDKKCITCHTEQKNESLHHDYMLKMFRNR